MKTKRRKKVKFLATFLLFIFLFALFLSGCVVADRNTRRIGFGDTTPIISRYPGEGDRRGLSVYLFGKSYTIDVTPWFWAVQCVAQGMEQAGRSVQGIMDSWREQITPQAW